MAIYVKDRETEAAVRAFASRKGISITAAIREAVDDARKRDIAKRHKAIREIQKRVAKMPKYMTNDEIDAWMYDENGLPH
jgi:hypothetical protein